MPRTTEKINSIDHLYPDKELVAKSLMEYPVDEILIANLQALSKVDSSLAETIEETKIPDNYQLAVTADGNFSYKAYDQNNIGRWLGNRATPAIAAKSDVKRQGLDLTNASMNGFGDGYTIKDVMQRLYPFQALFVLEKDPVIIKAALSIHDLSSYIESGQLVIIHGPDPYSVLTEYLTKNSGYQLIEKSLYRHELTEQENKVFTSHTTAAVEEAYQNVVATMDSVCKELAQIEPNKMDPGNLSNLTVINIPDFSNPKSAVFSRDILDGLAAKGLKTQLNTFDSPRYASTIMQLGKFIDQKPDIVVTVNNLRQTLKYRFHKDISIISILCDLTEGSLDNLDFSTLGANDIIVCEKQFIDQFPDNISDRLVTLEKYVNTDIYRPIAEEDRAEIFGKSSHIKASDVVVITERNPIHPEAYNVRLNSQITILNAACEAIAKDPAGYNKLLDKMYFDNAQKKSGIKINDDNLKESLFAIFCEIAKAVNIDCYGREMINAGFDISAYHYDHCMHGGFQPVNSKEDIPNQWEHSPLKGYVKGIVCDTPELNIINNSGKVFVCINNDGRVTQTMLNIVASGGFVLTKAHPRDNKPDGLRGYFEPGKEIVTFSTPSDLCRKIELYLKDEGKRIAIANNSRQKLLQSSTAKLFCDKILQKMELLRY